MELSDYKWFMLFLKRRNGAAGENRTPARGFPQIPQSPILPLNYSRHNFNRTKFCL